MASMRIIREGDYSHKVKMGGNDELSPQFHAGTQEFHQLKLEGRGEAVLRLIQQVKACFTYGFRKIHKGIFSIGVFAYAFRHAPAACIAGGVVAEGFPVCQKLLYSVLLVGIKPHFLNITPPVAGFLVEPQVSLLIIAPRFQDAGKDIVTGDVAAVCRNVDLKAFVFSGKFSPTKALEDIKVFGLVVRAAAPQLQILG